MLVLVLSVRPTADAPLSSGVTVTGVEVHYCELKKCNSQARPRDHPSIPEADTDTVVEWPNLV